jgi:RimJ/RimL family protein N-acetyltransferase
MPSDDAEFLFATPRLRVRRLHEGDVDALFAVYGDAEAMRWVGDGQPLSQAQCVQWVAVTRRNVATRGYGMSVLTDRTSGEVLGFCGLVHPNGQPEAEIKYALRRSAWGRGLATEAAAGMLAWGARAFGITRVIATAAADNTASHRVLRKAGLLPGDPRTEDDGTTTCVFVWRAAPS